MLQRLAVGVELPEVERSLSEDTLGVSSRTSSSVSAPVRHHLRKWIPERLTIQGEKRCVVGDGDG